MYEISHDLQPLYPEAAGKPVENWAAIGDRILAYSQRDGKLPLVLDGMTTGKLFIVVICKNNRAGYVGYVGYVSSLPL